LGAFALVSDFQFRASVFDAGIHRNVPAGKRQLRVGSHFAIVTIRSVKGDNTAK